MINSISPQVLVALATALLTAAVTLLSVFLTSRSQRKNEEAKFERDNKAKRSIFKREKLEELYLLFSKWDADLVTLSYLYIQVITGKAQEEEVLLRANKNQLSQKDYLQRILMMIHLYFPEFKEYFDEVLETRENIWSFCSEAFPPGATPEDLIHAQEEFRKTAKKFMQKIAGIAQTL